MKTLIHNVFRAYIRGFPLARGKSILLKLLWRPLAFHEFKRVVTLRQANVQISADLTKHIQRNLYFFGVYEEECCDLWIKCASTSQVIFDVGANVGLYSLLAAATNGNVQIHAFEPTPELVHTLEGNIQLNNLTNIVVNPIAIGQTTGHSYLHYHVAGSTNEGMNFVDGDLKQADDLKVEVTSIDDYCHKKGLSTIDLMKIDIEGSEYNALLGAGDLLSKRAIRCIFIEINEETASLSGHSTSDVKQLLIEAGYSLYRLYDRKLLPVTLDGGGSIYNAIAFADESVQDLLDLAGIQ